MVQGSHPSPVSDRLWPKIDRRGPDECWPWTAHKSPAGYGRLAVKRADGRWRPAYAHRLVYELTVGPIPEGLQIDHLCRNRACVNPAHLEPVTNRENSYRGQGFGAQVHRSTCVHGHPWDEANTYIRPDTGTRQCRACCRLRERGEL